MTEPSTQAARQERFTNGKRWVVTADTLTKKWGSSDGGRIKCGMCGHEFVEGEGVRWVYANGNTPSFGNFFTCDACDGPDVLERRTAAGIYARSLQFDYMVLAVQALKAAADPGEAPPQICEKREEMAQISSEEALLREALPELLEAAKRIAGEDGIGGHHYHGFRGGYEWVGRSEWVWAAFRDAVTRAEAALRGPDTEGK